jgi:hypothetical protein
LDTPETKEEIVQLYLRFGNKPVDNVTATDIAEFLGTIWRHKLIDRDAARELAQELLPVVADSENADFHAPLMLLLYPYLKEAGHCKPDPSDENAEFCAFSTSSGSPDVAAEYSHDQTGFHLGVNPPQPGSDLAYIVKPRSCDPAEQSAAVSSASSTGTADLIVSSACYSSDYWTGYGYRYKWEIDFGGFDAWLWGEAFGFAVLGLDKSMADTIVADIPVGLHCDTKCLLSTIIDCFDHLKSGDTKAAKRCLAAKAEKKSYLIHGDKSYIQHVHARVCNVMQATAKDRAHFKAYQGGHYDGRYELSPTAQLFVDKDDLRFQTNFQYPAQNSAIASDGRNLFPLPTSASLDQAVLAGGMQGPVLPGSGMPSWRHTFSQIRGWYFNIIFNAADALLNSNVLTGQRCYRNYQHPNRPGLFARGDQFQIYHGTAAALPEYNILIGWPSYHPAYVCTKNLN